MTMGLLKPDSFAEERLLLQPPGVCIYLIIYIASTTMLHNNFLRQRERQVLQAPKLSQYGPRGQGRSRQEVGPKLCSRPPACESTIYLAVHTIASADTRT